MSQSKEFVPESDDSSDKEVKSMKKQTMEKESEEKVKEEKKPIKQTTDKNIWELGNNHRVTVMNFKDSYVDKYYVDIREMYRDENKDLRPSKKGICLTMPQWRKFMEIVKEVDEMTK